jgi:hypothetical protein
MLLTAAFVAATVALVLTRRWRGADVPASQPDRVVAAVAMVTEAVRHGTGLADCASSTLPAQGGVCPSPVT